MDDSSVTVDTSPTVRVLHDPALAGATNMARDEALMARVGAGESCPTLRLYMWDPPTISLGYFQKYADYEALDPPAGNLAVVRRQTGGGAILHDRELTYSITLPIDHVALDSGPNELYGMAHDAVIASLRDLDADAHRGGCTDDSTPTRGPFFCFERRHCFDVLIGEDKLAGSAQRRTQQAILQHGSIIIGNRYTQQAAVKLELDFDRAIEILRRSFVSHLSNVTGMQFEQGDWSEDELASAQTLVEKYSGDEWTRRS